MLRQFIIRIRKNDQAKLKIIKRKSNHILMQKLRLSLFILLSACLFELYAVDMELVRAYNNPRIRAFLDMIAFAEGTQHDLGYRMQFTGVLFHSFKDHPRKKICHDFKNKELCSTAAGRYQILAKTWDLIASRIHAISFSPLYQDYGAIELIRQKGALSDIVEGRIGKAIKKLNKVWASFPGAPYRQPKKSIAELKLIYLERLRFHTDRQKSLLKGNAIMS